MLHDKTVLLEHPLNRKLVHCQVSAVKGLNKAEFVKLNLTNSKVHSQGVTGAMFNYVVLRGL